MGKVLGILTILIFLGGCSTGTQSSEPLSYPINSIYGAIETNLSMGIQGYSENHREITSRPFIVKQSDRAKRRVVTNEVEQK